MCNHLAVHQHLEDSSLLRSASAEQPEQIPAAALKVSPQQAALPLDLDGHLGGGGDPKRAQVRGISMLMEIKPRLTAK